MMSFILIVVAYELTNSNTAVSGIVLSFTIPAILFGIYAGSFVDKRDKKIILVWTNLLRAMLLFVLAFFHTNIFFLYVLTILITIITQFFIPAETPLVPLVVGKKLLLSANALFGMGIYGSILAAYALSGPVYLFFKEDVFFFLGFLFLIASCFSFFIRVPVEKKKIKPIFDQNVSFQNEVRLLFSVLSKTKNVYQAMYLLAMSQVITLILATIGPGYGTQVLGIHVDEFPLIFVTPAALGMFIGALILGNYFNNVHREKMAMIGMFISGFSILLLPFASNVASKGVLIAISAFLPSFLAIDILHIVIFLAFVIGLANAFVFVPSNTILQEQTTDAYRGRVYGLLSAMVGVASFIPIILVGGIADLLGVGRVLIGIGGTIVGLGFVRFFWRKK